MHVFKVGEVVYTAYDGTCIGNVLSQNTQQLKTTILDKRLTSVSSLETLDTKAILSPDDHFLHEGVTLMIRTRALLLLNQ